MGGIGSGGYFRVSNTTTTDEVKRIDIRYLRKQGSLRPGFFGTLSWSCGMESAGSINYRVEHNRLVLTYRVKVQGEWRDMNEKVPLTYTPCNYGGHRAWLHCPHCDKRVALLYGAGNRFLCRHCYDLSYSSQNESDLDRLMRKSRKIRKQLHASENLDFPIFDKPKGMHWKTFSRLALKEQAITRGINLKYEKILSLLR